MAKKLDKVDVVIVGVGWAGGILSAELAKSGKKVVALERGENKERSDYTGVKDELRFDSRGQMMQKPAQETITSRNKLDEKALPVRTIGNIGPSMITGTDLGGGSVHWSGSVYRYVPYDFEIRSKTIERYGEDKIPKDMTIQDWGITYEEMEPYYDKWEKTAGISGEQDPMAPKRKNKWPTPPMKETTPIKMFKEASANLGLHPYQMASANLSEQYENPDGQTLNACMYCSFCSRYGCDFGAKSDALVTVIPTAMEHDNFELRTQANVRRIIYDKNTGKAKGVMYVNTRTGEEYEQPADIVALSAMTFTNFRLLRMSEIGKQYDPETRTGVIGRNYNGNYVYAHRGASGYFKDKKFNLYMGAGGLGGALSDYVGDNFDHSDKDFIGGGGIEIRQYGEGAITRSSNVPSDTPQWGKEFKKNSLFYTYRKLNVVFTGMVGSYWHNYLDLDPNYTDSYGDPLVRVTYSLTDQERNVMQYGIDRCHEILKEMGADIIEDDPVAQEFDHDYFGGHHTGGMAMGDDPEISAVNTYLQMWDAENIFVVGGAAFPQFGHHHPTPTIGALAYRAAEGIDKYLDKGGQLVEAKSIKQNT